MIRVDGEFSGVRWMRISELGVSQLYLNRRKLDAVEAWFDPGHMEEFGPLPVHDFGSGRYTLTDGHSRAFTAYRAGVERIPVIYDRDEIVAGEQGLMLYRNDIVWCERFGIHGIADLAGRIVSDEEYERLWIGRCERGYNLLTQSTEAQRRAWAALQPGRYLFGASEDLSILYFEDESGGVSEEKSEANGI